MTLYVLMAAVMVCVNGSGVMGVGVPVGILSSVTVATAVSTAPQG